jgi:hypothetical protein
MSERRCTPARGGARPADAAPTARRRARVARIARVARTAAGLALLLAPAAALRADALQAEAPPTPSPPLFASHQPLDVTLSADFARLRQDRQESPDRPATVVVTGPDGAAVRIRAELRTRGAFRLDPSHCSFPPLRLDVDGGDARSSVFDGQDNLKIVASCRPGRHAYDQLVLLEYLAYRAYAALTDVSFRVRLARITFHDEIAAEEPSTRVGFFIEEDEALGERIGATAFELPEGKNLPASAFEPSSAAMTAVFQYVIGNSDWSEVAAHNVQVFDRAGAAIAVPYDFDFSGLVDAPYASPAADLGLRSVRDRLYRGWCWNDLVVAGVLQRFRGAEEEIVALFAEAEGLDGAVRGRAVAYLREGFSDLRTDDWARRRFLRDCRMLPS